MNPPIKVSVTTDNLRECKLHFEDANGVTGCHVVVPSEGNVYQGLHSARAGIETAINDILASHGIVPAPAAETAPEADADPTSTPKTVEEEAAEAELAVDVTSKKKAAKKS